MNSSSFDRTLRQVMIVPVLALLIGAGALFRQMRQANLAVRVMQTSNRNSSVILQLQKLILDQETGLRGYQTTADPTFLAPYNQASTQLGPSFETLHTALANDGPHQAQLDELQIARTAWENNFAIPTIRRIRGGDHTSDPALNLQGKQQMDDIRARFSALDNAFQQQRDQAVSHWQVQVRTMSIALVVFALLLGLLIGLYTRRLLEDVSAAFRASHNVLRLRAEETFRSEQKLRTTLAAIGDGVITCDADGHVQSMNDVAQELTGWTEYEARNLPLETVFNIINESSRETVENPFSKVKRLNRIVGLANHTILIRKDASELHIDDSGAPIRDKTGRLIGVVLVFRDVTMARKSQQALIANEKLAVAGRLAATIAHEIHNPLDSVSNLLFLLDAPCTPEEREQFLKLARQEITRVTQISRAMLSLYRESRVPVPVELRDMLESVLLLLERRFAQLGVTISVNLPEECRILGFPAELRQVFTNLLVNAAEASTPGGSVALSAMVVGAGIDANGLRREPGSVVTIQDHGLGISDEVKARLFKPFFTTKGELGTGLGLWVSRGIIMKHGGEIMLASSTAPEDHGTTVTVYLADHPIINPGGD